MNGLVATEFISGKQEKICGVDAARDFIKFHGKIP